MKKFRQWLIEKLGGFTSDMSVYAASQVAVSLYLESQEENRRLRLQNFELATRLEEMKKNAE